MEYSNFLEPGVWRAELNRNGEPVILELDPSYLRLVGYESQQAFKEAYPSPVSSVHPEDRDRLLATMNDCVAPHPEGKNFDCEYRLKTAGGYRWIHNFASCIRREDGALESIRGVIFDIQASKDLEKQRRIEKNPTLSEQERALLGRQEMELVKSRLRADALSFVVQSEPDLDRALEFFGNRILTDSGCDQVVFTHINGKRYVFNAPGIEDYDKTVCAGCPFENPQDPAFDDSYVVYDDLDIGSRGGISKGIRSNAGCPVKSAIMQRVYVDGELTGMLSVHYLSRKHSFSDESIEMLRSMAGFLGLFIGRVNAKGAEIARIRAESSDRAKTEFLFNMSHDIRTPMNAILGFADKALRNADNPDTVRESLKKVKDSGEYLLHIINDILDMAKIESGTLELKESLRTGRSRKTSLLNMFRAEAEAKDISLITEVDMPNPCFWVDEDRTNQIVANLISNSIKYTPAGGTVWYRVKQLPDEREGWTKFEVSVEDNGRGMSPEFVSGIFDAFKRDRSAISSGVQGTGLGMAIVKKLCDAMGAEIKVESELGKGTKTTFVVSHRLGTAEELAEAMAKEQLPELALNSLKGKRALLAEDNELNREIALDILADEGVEADVAVNGAEAVELVRENSPAYYDFVLMDIQMPVMNGYEATKAIREEFPGAKLPIIALSANAFTEDKAASRAAGMDAHVAKPINIKELMATLAAFV